MLATDRWLLGAGFPAQGHSVNTTDQGEIDAARDLLIEAKRTLLAYDDTTFLFQAGPGRPRHPCLGRVVNYGIGENPAIRFAVPRKGSDLWLTRW